MEALTVAIIGTGDPSVRDETGYAMAYEHAKGYLDVPGCDLVACADIVEKNARTFATRFDIPRETVYADAETMIEQVDPEVVSVCTPIRTHAGLVTRAARTGESLRGIHCEKPMAWTWREAKEMARVAHEHDVQLTFNHQRRFATPVRRAQDLVTAGRIGDVERIEMGPSNLYDYGTHSIDLANAFTDEADIEWVIANIDTRAPARWFDIKTENHGLAMWRTDSGVFCLASTGDGAEAIGCHHRIRGTDGIIELGVGETPIRIRGQEDSTWRVVDTNGETMHGPGLVEKGIREVIDSLRTGRPSTLRAEHALRATEVIFASYESARRGGRIDLPLTIEDNPLEELLGERA